MDKRKIVSALGIIIGLAFLFIGFTQMKARQAAEEQARAIEAEGPGESVDVIIND